MNRKPIFDVVRGLMGRGFSTADVGRLDRAIDVAMEGRVTPDAPRQQERADVPSRIGVAGLEIIKQFEGCARVRNDGMVEAYPDPGTGGEPWTIGWGATRHGLYGMVGPNTVWTQEQCDKRLEADLRRYADAVVAALGAAISNTSQAQFDALVSFHYNTGAIGRATLTRKHKAGDYQGAAAEFARWNKAGGRVLGGLIRRRKAEADLYRSGS